MSVLRGTRNGRKYLVGNAVVNQAVLRQKVVRPRSPQFQLHNVVIVVAVIPATKRIGPSAYTAGSNRKTESNELCVGRDEKHNWLPAAWRCRCSCIGRHAVRRIPDLRRESVRIFLYGDANRLCILAITGNKKQHIIGGLRLLRRASAQILSKR